MKQTIRLKEQEFKHLIKEAIKEVKYGGVEFHGNNPEDWSAMHQLRLYSPVNLQNYDKADRNRSNMKDFFDKNWGEYETEKSNGSYQFPHEDERNKAQDWLSDKDRLAFIKTDQALHGANKIKKEKGIQILQKLISNHQPFYTKKWQSNGYFPISKWEYNPERDEYTSTWGQHVSYIPLEKVIYAVSCDDDLFTPEKFSDSHSYEERGVDAYPIYGAMTSKPTEDDKQLDETITHNKLRRSIRESVERVLKELLNEMDEGEYDEPMNFSVVANLLSKNGWSIFHSSEVTDRDYRSGVRINIKPDSKHSTPYEELKQQLIDLCDEYNTKEELMPGMGQYTVTFSSGQYRYAPENKFISIIIWNLE